MPPSPAVGDEPGLLALPDSLLARDVIQLITRTESPSIANHSIRSYLFARLLADHRGLVAGRDYDEDLLFFACALHDMGLTKAGNRGQRFEVDGADLAAEFLARREVAPEKVDVVWQAIALNTSPGIAERRGTVCALTLGGIVADFGGDSSYVSDDTARAIHRDYPRLQIGRALADAIVAQAADRPEKAPLFSMPAQLVHERTSPPHVTAVEQMAVGGRWGA